MARTKRPPLRARSFVMNDNGMYVDLDSLTPEERANHAKYINRNAMRGSAAYRGYSVRFEGDTAILTARNVRTERNVN